MATEACCLTSCTASFVAGLDAHRDATRYDWGLAHSFGFPADLYGRRFGRLGSHLNLRLGNRTVDAEPASPASLDELEALRASTEDHALHDSE